MAKKKMDRLKVFSFVALILVVIGVILYYLVSLIPPKIPVTVEAVKEEKKEVAEAIKTVDNSIKEKKKDIVKTKRKIQKIKESKPNEDIKILLDKFRDLGY